MMPPAAPGHHRTPSPTTSRRGFEGYNPPRSAPSFRDEAHRPPYRFNGYDRFAASDSRPYQRESWEAVAPGWQGSGYDSAPNWQDPREPIPPSPTGSARSHGRNDILATRMFGSPEGAKHPPVDRWARHDAQPYAQERYYDPSPPRSVQEPIMNSLTRQAPRNNYNVGPDRFRHPPPTKRASHPNMRSEYRVPYDTKRDERGPLYRESGPSRSHQMDSTPPIAAPSRSWGHFEPPSTASRNTRFPSISRTRTPERRASGSVSLSPHFREGSRARDSWDANDVSTKKELSRQSSLSSIASTQVSEHPARDTRPASKPPDLSSAPPDTARSTSVALGESSSGPSSTCSSPRQVPLSGPQAALATRFKSLNPSGPISSPLSSVVTAENEADASKSSAHVPSSTNGNHGIFPNSPSITLSSLAETPVNPPLLEKTPANHVVNGATKANAQNDVSSPIPAHLRQSHSEDQTRKTDAPSALDLDPVPTVAPAVEGTLMDVDEPNDPPPSPRVKPSEEQPTPSKEVPEPVIADQAPVFKGFAAVPFSQPTTFAFGSRPELGPDDQVDDLEVLETDTTFEEELPPREPVILLQLRPMFPPNAPITDKEPSVTAPASLQEALRGVVMTRMVYDKQTRDDVVNPVLLANRALIEALPPQPTAKSSPHHLIAEVHRSLDENIDYPTVRESLAIHFEERQNLINDKAHRLSEEYLRLHKKWKAHCDVLDAQQRINSNEAEQLLHGRTTRRTAAFTDTVRSDLEMEQVIASLGVDDLTDPSYLSSRNSAIIPDMVAVTEGEVDYLFDDTNHLVEDPEEYYGPHTGIDDWTEEEKRVFIDRFAMYPKQFGLIADHIPHKTAAQCVDYYYLHKKRIIDFRKVVSQLAPNKRKKRGGGKKKGNALLTDIAQHDAEVGKDHLSTFIVPSRVAKGKRKGRAAAVKAQSSTPATANTPQPEVTLLEGLRASRSQVKEGTPVATPTPEPPEGRPKRSSRKSGVVTTQPSAASTPAPAQAPEPSTAPPIVAPVLVPVIPLPPAASEPKPSKTVEVPVAALPPLSVEPESPQKLAKKAKRGRKQVKSAAIILDEPPSPPANPDTALASVESATAA
ncbi:hypothetical protein BKA70DRAFT_4748 [Coprinopsis sp. MPI-PUGE-AT-0042]|nr:hypothetical protein BKA70DRAFT_4748 [Coprinopsis sp. MPI-PUGE-AT-0042]